MAQIDLVKDLQDNFLQCAICMESYKSPRMLPCIHSFCLKCLEKLAQSLQNKPLSCPTCRAAVAIPKTGLKDLPSNFLLVSLMERLNLADTTGSTSLVCHFCHGNKNIQRCIDCDIHVCVTCRQFHDKVPGCRDHRLIPVDKLADETYMSSVLALEVPRCLDHRKEKLRFYCTPCGKLVCRDCAIVSHRGHKCTEAEKWFGAVKHELNTAVQSSQQLIESIRQISGHVTTSTAKVEKHISECQQQIDQEYRLLSKELKNDRCKLLQQLEDIKEQHYIPLKEVQDGVTNWKKAMKNTRVVTTKILAGNNQWVILRMEKELTAAFKKLCDDVRSLESKRSRINDESITGVSFCNLQERSFQAQHTNNLLGTITEFQNPNRPYNSFVHSAFHESRGLNYGDQYHPFTHPNPNTSRYANQYANQYANREQPYDQWEDS